MKKTLCAFLILLAVGSLYGQNKFIPPMKPRGFVTTAVLAESTTVLRSLAGTLIGALSPWNVDSNRVHGAGLAIGTRGNLATWEGADTLGSHFFPVMIFQPVDSSFLAKYDTSTSSYLGPYYNGPDSLLIDSLRAINPNAASGDTVGFRFVFGMIPFAWTDSTADINAYNNGTTWNTLGFAQGAKVIKPYWSYMVKIVRKKGSPPGRAVFGLRGRYRW
jgi:hypothetical protein